MHGDTGEHGLVPADPVDDYVVALARSAHASVVVSGDTHLLGISSSELPVMSPREFLARLTR